ncbi:MAG: hypothetical protein J6M02_04495 [Clostridia bacterium]|nr:hypothetical protein [Clostridia bacterium]
MANELPEKYEGGFWCRVRRFFSSMFKKKNERKEFVESGKIEVQAVKKNEFEEMKKESHKVQLKENILSMIDDHPQLIDTLPIPRLKELSKMYDGIIEENDRKIKKLERAVG